MASCLLLVLGGCTRPTGNVSKTAVEVTETRDDSTQLALEFFRQAQELSQFREALNHISGPLLQHAGNATTALDSEARQRLQKLAHLEPAELDEIDSASPQPLDAAYLESCFLFRDAARALEAPGLPLREQAALDFAWVMRRVLLYEAQDEGVPAHLVLKRGWGSSSDRAIVVLELLRQRQLAGCVVDFPGQDGRQRQLVGILVPQKDRADLLLFDPRLGLAVPGPKGQGIATLADVRAEPKLLEASGLTPGDLKQATARLTYPYAAFAPRMKSLQEILSVQERVVLHRDLVTWQRDVAATGLPVEPWPADTEPMPSRALRLFYRSEHGGIDPGQRLIYYKAYQAPLSLVIDRFQQMRVFTELPDEGREQLMHFMGSLFEMYYMQPRAELVRGNHEAVLKRADRIGAVIEQADFAAPIEEEQFQQQIAQWRNRLNEAYLSRDEARIKNVWNEDQYVLALLQPEAAAEPQRYQRKMLTHILLRAGREPLGNHIEALKAACWDDKAAKLQAQSDERRQAGKTVRAKDDAQSAWKNARSAWAKYLARADVAPGHLLGRLGPIVASWRQGPAQKDLAVGLWEQLHADLHRALDAHIRLAEANQRLGQTPLALSALGKVREDVATLLKQEQPRKLLQECLDQSRAQPVGAHVKRLELLTRTWTPDGHLASFGARAERLTAAWK